MIIAELLQALKRANPDADVRFDFCGCSPTTVDSSRGDYSIPALGWHDGQAPTVSALVRELDMATDGREYTGWKGGEYTYTTKDCICVDNPGKWTSTELLRVEDKGWQVILHTQMEG